MEGNHARVGATELRGAKAGAAKAAMVRHVAKAATTDPAAKAKGVKADTTGQDGKASGAKEVTPGNGRIAAYQAHHMALQGHPRVPAADSSLANAKAASPGRAHRSDPEDMAEGAETGADTIGAVAPGTVEAETAAVISEDPKAKAASAGTSAPAS